MKKRKQRPALRRDSADQVMVMPRQSVDEIWRRREIREALHDLKARIIPAKNR